MGREPVIGHWPGPVSSINKVSAKEYGINVVRGSWPENEGENEATVLDLFSADRPHGIHGFWSRKQWRNPPLDLEKFLESGPQNSGFLAGE